jgi:hypothetical protein
MNSKRLFDAAMIFLIGASPLGIRILETKCVKNNLDLKNPKVS